MLRCDLRQVFRRALGDLAEIAKQLGDLRQVFRRALVMLRRCARDHLKIADLKVISRTSTQHYKSAPENLPEIAKLLCDLRKVSKSAPENLPEIATQHGVAHILSDSAQKSG